MLLALPRITLPLEKIIQAIKERISNKIDGLLVEKQ